MYSEPFSPLLIGIAIVTKLTAVPTRPRLISEGGGFQSPFNRDSNCNGKAPPPAAGIHSWTGFQSPFNRDSNCNPSALPPCCKRGSGDFQSPFNRDSNCNDS